MNTTATADNLRESSSLRIVGVYSDLLAHEMGRLVLSNIAQQCSPVCDIDSEWWSFDTLKSSLAHEIAARAARNADMIWCSTHACEALPHAVRAWLHNSVEQSGSDSALVALLQCPSGYQIKESPALSYLCSTAETAGIEFFVRRFDSGCRALLKPRSAESRPPSEPDFVVHRNWQQFWHWGINE